jgi:hypothetical protein
MAEKPDFGGPEPSLGQGFRPRRGDRQSQTIVSVPELNERGSRYPGRASDDLWVSSGGDRGGLVGYGPDLTELIQQAVDYVARIFQGASPGELPTQGPTHYGFAVNLKTAKALGLTVPQSLLARADE